MPWAVLAQMFPRAKTKNVKRVIHSKSWAFSSFGSIEVMMGGGGGSATGAGCGVGGASCNDMTGARVELGNGSRKD